MRVRRLVISLACVAAVSLMGYGQYLIRLNPDDNRATALFLAAAAAAALLLRWEGAWPEPVAAVRVSGQRSWLGVALIVVGLAALAPGSLLLARAWQSEFYRGWGLLFGGTILLSLGFRRLDPHGPWAPAWTRTEFWALVAIVLLGFVLRFYRYTDFPGTYGIHAIEEPQVGMRSAMILQGVHPWEFIFDNYLGAAGIYLRRDPSILSIRIPFTVVSALTTVPVHLALRALVSPPAALAGAFLFSVSSWNIIYSRCAHAVFPTNILVVTALALLLRFGRSRRLTAVPWIGLLCGLTLYGYAAYRGTPLLTLIFLGTTLIGDLRSFRRVTDSAARQAAVSAIRRDLGALATVVAMVAAWAWPIYVMTSSNAAQPSYYFEAAIRSLSNKSYYTSDPAAFARQRLERIRSTANIFMHHGDDSDTFNSPGEPMVDPLTGVCLTGGLMLALGFPRRRFHAFLLFMFAFLLLGGAVFVQNLDVRRLQGVTPFVAIFAALFIDRLWAFARHLPGGRVIAAVIVVVGAAFTVGWNYNVYFNKMAHNTHVRQGFLNRYTIVIHYGRTRGAGREILLLSDLKYFFTPSDYYWLIETTMKGRALSDLSELLPPAQLPPAAKRRSVVIQHPHERHAIARLLTDLYPGTVCEEFIEPDNGYITLTACDLPDHLTPQALTMALTARYWLGPSAEGAPVVERSEPFIGYALVPKQCYSEQPFTIRECTAEWTGTLQIPTAGEYRFIAEGREGATLSVLIDDQPVGNGPIRLDAGTHRVVAHGRMRRIGETGVRLLWQTPRGPEPVPFYTIAAAPETATTP